MSFFQYKSCIRFAIIDGVIQPQYGGRGTQFNENHIPPHSLPFGVEDAPSGTALIAVVLEDKDAYPVTGGFAWIHWLAANITRFEIKDNESQTATDFIQVRNSWTSIQGGEQSAVFLCFSETLTQRSMRRLPLFCASSALQRIACEKH